MKRMVKFAAVIVAFALLVLPSVQNAHAQTACSPAPPNIVGWWPGDGNANDIIGGNNGSLAGGVTFAPGEVGQAFSFDGVGYVDIPASLNISGQITVDAWVNPNEFNTYQEIFANMSTSRNLGDVDLRINGPGSSTYVPGTFSWLRRETQGSVGVAFVSTSTLAVAGAWQHVAAVFDGSNYLIYVNGVVQSGAVQADAIVSGGADYTIGAFPGGSDPFNGLIDEVQIFNRALSAAEIQAIYNAGVAGNCKGLAFSPASLKFPRRAVGTTSPPDVVTASNEFPLAVTVKKVVTSGDFAQTNTCPALPSTLAPGASCTVSVTFTPTQSGTRTGRLTIVDSAPANPQSVGLVGAATDISLSVTRLSFGSHKVGTTTGAGSVTATNVGSVVVNFTGSGIALAGADPSDFIISANACGPSLASGASCTVSIEFKPTTQGTRTATLDFNDDGGGSPQKVALSGTGT